MKTERYHREIEDALEKAEESLSKAQRLFQQMEGEEERTKTLAVDRRVQIQASLLKPLSSAMYVASGARCPVCLSQTSLAILDSIDITGPTGTAKIKCLACGSQWKENWQMIGYSELNRELTARQLKEIQATLDNLKIAEL